MRSFFAFLLVLIVGVGVGACHAFSASTSVTSVTVTHEHVEDARMLEGVTIGLVEPGRDGSPHVYCSGVWVSEYRILTAAHCVEDKSMDAILGYVTYDDVYDGTKLREEIHVRTARLEHVDKSHDLALIVGSVIGLPVRCPEGRCALAHPVARVSNAAIRKGAHVQAMGHSIGLWFSYSSGDIAAIREGLTVGLGEIASAPDMTFIQSTTPVSPGNSGGGLFNEDGELIGICHGSFTRGQGLNLFVHRDHIALFLARAGV